MKDLVIVMDIAFVWFWDLSFIEDSDKVEEDAKGIEGPAGEDEGEEDEEENVEESEDLEENTEEAMEEDDKEDKNNISQVGIFLFWI